jgi:ABC-type cobalamin transport system permease subunit
MSEQATWLDGNGVAGLMREVFGTEMSTALRVCAGCGDRHALGTCRAYVGAGVVLRCPSCSRLAVAVATLPDRHVVSLTGTWTLEVPRS